MTLTSDTRATTPSPAPTIAEAAILTRDLAIFFGRSEALHPLNLAIPQSAIYALVGPNGAGKSTLIKLLLNILRPTSGAATVLGLPSSRIAGPAFTRIGYVSENQELPEWMTVTELLGYLRPFYPQWDTSLEHLLLRQFDLPLNRKLRHLSRGQRMKAALLSVLPYRPSLIVLDEPFSGLDPLVRDELIESLLDRVSSTDGHTPPPTILISSHDLAEIETLATHVGYLDRGRLLFSEEIANLTARFREVTVTLAPHGDPANLSAVAATAPTPPAWLLPESTPSVLRFIHTHADTEPVREQVASILPNASAVDLQPMTLREIFLALAKSTRHAAAADHLTPPQHRPQTRQQTRTRA